MDDLDRETVLADLERIAQWLAEDVENDEAQGAASDLNAIRDYLTMPGWIVRMLRDAR